MAGLCCCFSVIGSHGASRFFFRSTYEQYVNEIIVEPFKGKDLSKPDESIDHVSCFGVIYPSKKWNFYYI